MKLLSLLLWVGQFGFSVVFPTVFFLVLGAWLENRFQLGTWVTVLGGILGLLTSITTARSCLRALRRAAGEAGSEKEPPVSFNEHN